MVKSTSVCVSVVYFVGVISILPASTVVRALLEVRSPGCYINGGDGVSFLSKL